MLVEISDKFQKKSAVVTEIIDEIDLGVQNLEKLRTKYDTFYL